MLHKNIFKRLIKATVGLVLALFLFMPAQAIPNTLHWQGKLYVNGLAHNGNAEFLFALLSGNTVVWTSWEGVTITPPGLANAAPYNLNSPAGANWITTPVVSGLYSMPLGDTTIPNMAAMTPGLFASDLQMRVWVRTSVGNERLMSPDETMHSVPYAFGSLSTPPGTVIMFAGGTAPAGYFICDGSAVDRVVYAALFAVIGTTYGAGDGSTTFNLPDLRGRTAMGPGTTPGGNGIPLAGSFGSDIMTVAQMPTHAHGIWDIGHTHAIHDTGHGHYYTDNGHIHDLGVGVDYTNVNPNGDQTGLIMRPIVSMATNRNVTGIVINGAYPLGSNPGTGISIVSAGTGIQISDNGSNQSFLPPAVGLNYLIKY